MKTILVPTEQNDVMDAVPESRLIMVTDPGQHRQRTHEAMGRMGIDPSRIEFHPRCPLMLAKCQEMIPTMETVGERNVACMRWREPS